MLWYLAYLAFFSLPVYGASIGDFTGEYRLDLKRTTNTVDHTNILNMTWLKINPDKSIEWGGGKKNILRFVKDFDDKGVAVYNCDGEDKGLKYIMEVPVILHTDGYLEIGKCFFKVVKTKQEPPAGKAPAKTE